MATLKHQDYRIRELGTELGARDRELFAARKQLTAMEDELAAARATIAALTARRPPLYLVPAS